MKIDPLINVTYKTAQEALDAGKQPCRVCNPPLKMVSWKGSCKTSNTAVVSLPQVIHPTHFFAFPFKLTK
jgi:hypothetical protein